MTINIIDLLSSLSACGQQEGHALDRRSHERNPSKETPEAGGWHGGGATWWQQQQLLRLDLCRVVMSVFVREWVWPAHQALLSSLTQYFECRFWLGQKCITQVAVTVLSPTAGDQPSHVTSLIFQQEMKLCHLGVRLPSWRWCFYHLGIDC